MNDKVTVLRPDRASEASTSEPSQETIEMLESMLEQAREGRLIGIAVAGVRNDYQFETSWTGTARCADTAACIALLQYRFMSAWHGSPT